MNRSEAGKNVNTKGPAIAPPSQSRLAVLAQAVGLHPLAACLAFAVHLIFRNCVAAGWEAFAPVDILLSVGLGISAYHLQRARHYGDGHESSKRKAVMIAVVTGTLVPLGPILAAALGLAGLVHVVNRWLRPEPTTCGEIISRK